MRKAVDGCSPVSAESIFHNKNDNRANLIRVDFYFDQDELVSILIVQRINNVIADMIELEKWHNYYAESAENEFGKIAAKARSIYKSSDLPTRGPDLQGYCTFYQASKDYTTSLSTIIPVRSKKDTGIYENNEGNKPSEGANMVALEKTMVSRDLHRQRLCVPE